MCQVEVPEWYVPGAVRATSPETPRMSAAVQASSAATQKALAAFDITHGQLSACTHRIGTLLHIDDDSKTGAMLTTPCQCYDVLANKL